MKTLRHIGLALAVARAARALAATAQDSLADPRIAEMWNVAGFTYVIIGEHYCSGVPFPAEGETSAPPIATSEIFNQAIVRFDRAIANFGDDSTRLWTAWVGKARALLDLNQPAAAAALLGLVPDNFAYKIEHSD